MPQQWAVRLAIEGDLRFASHHDVMRTIERVVLRARIPVRYTQGYNPHPILSLLLPRPVGVATLDDVLTARLRDGADASAAELAASLTASAPRGMRFGPAELVPAGATPRASEAHYALELSGERVAAARERLESLSGPDAWTIERVSPAKRRGRPPRRRRIDLRPLVPEARIEDGKLRLKLVPSQERWARPAEVLELLGLDGRVDLASLVRTRLVCPAASHDVARN